MGRRRIDRWKTPPGWKTADGCTILDCGRKGIARGMCWNHYMRARRGDPVFVYLAPDDVGSRMVIQQFGPERPSYSFLRMNRLAWEIRENVTWEPTTGCALWLGDIHPNGYGMFGYPGDPWGRWAHRAALWFAGVRFEADRKRHVRHLCDQPACVNPRHLVYGTAKENMADRDRRYRREGRKMDWVRRGPRKMTEAQIAYSWAAHEAGVTYADLGRELGVSWATVRRHVLSVAIHHQNVSQAA